MGQGNFPSTTSAICSRSAEGIWATLRSLAARCIGWGGRVMGRGTCFDADTLVGFASAYATNWSSVARFTCGLIRSFQVRSPEGVLASEEVVSCFSVQGIAVGAIAYAGVVPDGRAKVRDGHSLGEPLRHIVVRRDRAAFFGAHFLHVGVHDERGGFPVIGSWGCLLGPPGCLYGGAEQIDLFGTSRRNPFPRTPIQRRNRRICI